MLEGMTIEELGRHAVTLKSWAWMPGIADTGGDRILYARGAGWCTSELVGACRGYDSWQEHAVHTSAHLSEPWRFAPDFADAATRGCALEAARVALNDPTLYVKSIPGKSPGWMLANEYGPLTAPSGVYRPIYSTEAHALVSALEIAHA